MYNRRVRISRLEQVILLSVVGILFSAPAFCARADKGASSYGQDTAPCPAGSGPQSPTAFDGITASCFGPGSGVGNATLFELKNNSSSFPSTIDVLVSFSQPATTDYGLLTCDNGNIPCTNKDPLLGPINPGDFSGNPIFGPDNALFTFSNFNGELAFYVNEAATITDVRSSATPEPRNTALLGLLLLCSLVLIRRFVAKPRSVRVRVEP
jgi:hypothetical protein